MKLYNTLTKKIEAFVPINQEKVGLYACGFTVYDYTHLGHLRKYTMDDILVRVLQRFLERKSPGARSATLSYIRNVTDVGHLASDADTGEDKLEKGAKKYGKSVWDIAREFEEYFTKSMDLMGNIRPDVSCRATEHIKEQLEMVQELEKKGFTYIIPDDGVYFDTSLFPEYGAMAGLQLEDQQEGARIGLVEGKKNPSDFALWKFERPGENRAMVWESPWAERGFPGWHIECSAMAMKYLGEQFDIHTGGIDHIPVHHTNEIAQAEAATGKKPFVQFWVHHNFLKIDGEKMSKSLGNFYTVDDVLERGFAPMALRLLFLTAHYRSEMNFTWENLKGAQKAYDKLVKNFQGLQKFQEKSEENLANAAKAAPVKKISAKAEEYRRDFFAELENDLNTPKAVAVLWSLFKNAELSSFDVYSLMQEFCAILGLKLESTKVLPQEIQALFDERLEAKQKKDYQKADEIRTALKEKGWIVEDMPEGVQNIRKDVDIV